MAVVVRCVVQSSDRITATDASPAQEKLAAMQTGSRTVSRSLVAAFDRTLTRLEGKCRQSRTSSLSLGDMAVSASRMAKQSDRSLTLLEALEAIDKSIPDDAPTKLGKLDCVDIIGLVLTTMGVKAPK